MNPPNHTQSVKKVLDKSTSWGNVANWYDNLVESEASYQRKLILPNLIRLLEAKKGGRMEFSHKVSEPGPKKEAEDKARREFPLFLFLGAIKLQ